MPDIEDRYRIELAGAAIAGIATAASTFFASDLNRSFAAAATAGASLTGWALTRVFTHRDRRAAHLLTTAALFCATTVTILLGGSGRCSPEGIWCFVGDCDTFSVYVQNRWQPYGAALRARPAREGLQLGSLDPNQLIPVDGWVRTSAAYPSNIPPFNNDVWFHVAGNKGWLSFAGVRADPTLPAADPRDTDGGAPAPTPASCRGTFNTNE